MWIKKMLCGLGIVLAVAGAQPAVAASQFPTLSTPSHGSAPELASSSVLMFDLDSGREIYSSQPDLVRPIASITKLMTAMVVLDSNMPLDETLTVTIEQVHEMRGVYSRVRLGSQQTRRQLLQLALMSSENRAAATLAHYYPGGYPAFIQEMNMKAKALGMAHTRFVEPTGLSEYNVSSARDLMQMVRAANRYGLIRAFSTTRERTVAFNKPAYVQGFFNTSPLVRGGDWTIYMSKTGFTNKAGNCLVMAANVSGKRVGMVLLDSFGKYTRFADAKRLRAWLQNGQSEPLPANLRQYKQQRNQGLTTVLQARR